MSMTKSAGIGMIAFAWLLATPPADAAEQRTPAEATAHARDELDNAVAQGKVTLTPTLTPQATRTPTLVVPTVTPQVALVVSTPTPEPCWVTDTETLEVAFDENGVPIPCPTILFPDMPPDDGLAMDPGEPVTLAPPPADPAQPVATTPTPAVVYVIVQQPAPPQQVVYMQAPAPTAQPAGVIYVVITPTPIPSSTPTQTATATPTKTIVPITPTLVRTVAPSPTALAVVETEQAEQPPATGPPEPDAPIEHAPLQVPLAAFWLLLSNSLSSLDSLRFRLDLATLSAWRS